jgi:hypothetical protein
LKLLKLKLVAAQLVSQSLKTLTLPHHKLALMDTVLGSLFFQRHSWSHVACGPLDRVDSHVVDGF